MKAGIIVFLLSIVAGCSTSRAWTKAELALAGVSVAASAWSLVETENMLDRENTYEWSPVLGRHPSDTRLIITTALVEALVLGVAHRWPTISLFDQDYELRCTLLFGKTVVNTGLALHDRNVGK